MATDRKTKLADPGPFLRYGVSLFLIGIAGAVDFSVPNLASRGPFLPFYLSTSLAAWFGGFRAGLFSTLLSLIMVDYFFFAPQPFWFPSLQLFRLLGVVAVMGTISFLIDNRFQSHLWRGIRGLRAKGANRRFQAMLSNAAHIAGMGSWEYDILHDRLEWDDETLRIFGISRKDFGGNIDAFFALVHPGDREKLKAMQAEAFASHGVIEMQYRIIRPDGVERRIHDRGQVTSQQHGKATQITGLVMDITESKQAEEALRASEHRWQAIFENSGVGIALADEKGFLTLTNRAFQKLVGYTGDELREMTFLDLTYEKDRPANLVLAKRLWHGDLLQFQHEKRYTRKDGNLIWVRITVTLIPGTDLNTLLAMAVVEDITETRLLEEHVRQSQRMEAVGRLAGGVAHDFNNMLGVILGHCARLLENLPVGTAEWQSALRIKEASTRSADLTRQLLAFSRKQILLPAALDLNAIISDLKNMLSSLIGDDIDLLFQPGQELGYVYGDRGQIEQVVTNLVVNARDAMTRGGKIIIATNRQSFDSQATTNLPIKAGSYIVLSVSDNGGGIEADTLNHIFEPFFTTKEQGRGTGLGLATVYGIVKQSGGNIGVETQIGKGTTFRIYLPQTEIQPIPTADQPEVLTGDACNETILLAEDEDLLREVIRLQLESGGYTVLEAQDGKAALALAKSYTGRIDLLLTDVLMTSDTSGLELSSQISHVMPDIKVLYMTGYTAEVIGHKGLSVIQEKILQKPFDASSLRRKIREILSAK